MSRHPREKVHRLRHLAATGACLVLLTAAGCASSSSPEPPARAAPPQHAALRWVERLDGTKLTFSVERFEVTASGWHATVSVDNATATDLVLPRIHQFGVMLFRTGTPNELEARNTAQELPDVRSATRFRPALPSIVLQGTKWTSTISAPGALAAGRFVRVVFGPFAVIGSSSKQLPTPLIWITDHSYRLRG